ncbi:50S ribosomal protein L21 [Qipengyuania sediminis]|uniref:50S ribosomal protein L21 n=1 Tax=Qipengyuania sediminis TaxID=1532023 RepID=UPI001059B5E0|nr:50S ribosomal protein L21 [Qipengyuania sediminis]
MFAVVRTGGKQYRVAAGDKIAVEKLAGEAGDRVELGDVLLAGSGDALEDAGKVVVAAEIIAQAKSEKVVVFKKRRRHNYRRKNGHRQQMTLLRILSVGDSRAPANDARASKAPVAVEADTEAPVAAPAAEPVAASPAEGAPATAKKSAPKKSAPKKAAATGEKGSTMGEPTNDTPATEPGEQN